MIFDTDILIWMENGNSKAAKLVNDCEECFISLQTYMEFMQCSRSKKELLENKDFLNLYKFQTLPLTEEIGHRAAILIEEYSLSSGLLSGDAIIAATAAEHNLPLATGNKRHFKDIKDLKVHSFNP